MSATGLEVFDKSIQTTNIWLDEIMEDMGPDRQLAWHLLGGVLRTMRDRLPLISPPIWVRNCHWWCEAPITTNTNRPPHPKKSGRSMPFSARLPMR